LLLQRNAIFGPKETEGAMAPLGATQDAKTTNGSGELLPESAAIENHPAPLTAADMISRLAGIGVLLLGVVAAFLYLGARFTPQKLTPGRFVDALQRVGGIHSGFRRKHAKGVDIRGFSESNGQGARLSKAVVFQPGRVPVIGRFSLGGGDPHTAGALSSVRGLGLQLSLPGGNSGGRR
jgi:catalase